MISEGEASHLRWGVLGAAKIARERVIPAVQASQLHRFVALGSRDKDLAAATASRLGVDRAYGSYAEVLEDDEVDAVYIPLPNHLHVEWTLRAIEAGKHVLCEKPLAMTAADAARISGAASAGRVHVMEGFMVFFHPRWHAVRELIGSGEIGEIGSIHFDFANPNPDPGDIRNQPEMGGGALYDKGCYCIALCRFLLGSEPDTVLAAMTIDPVFKVDRVTTGLMRFDSINTTFTCSSKHAQHQHVTIMGTKGRIEVPVAVTPPPDQPTVIRIDPGQDLLGTGAREIVYDPCNQYRLMFDAFATASPEANPPLSLEFSEGNARIIEKIIASANKPAR